MNDTTNDERRNGPRAMVYGGICSLIIWGGLLLAWVVLK